MRKYDLPLPAEDSAERQAAQGDGASPVQASRGKVVDIYERVLARNQARLDALRLDPGGGVTFASRAEAERAAERSPLARRRRGRNRAPLHLPPLLSAAVVRERLRRRRDRPGEAAVSALRLADADRSRCGRRDVLFVPATVAPFTASSVRSAATAFLAAQRAAYNAHIRTLIGETADLADQAGKDAQAFLQKAALDIVTQLVR